MGLRLITLWEALLIKRGKTILFLILLLSAPFAFTQNPSSQKELKKEAATLFEQGSYPEAYKLYAQLVANFPHEPEYNFRLGVCMIYSEPDKKKCLIYLRQAAAYHPQSPKETFFYLGKACHINYLFDEAIKYYNEYKKTASSSDLKKLDVDREIQACINGKHLLSNMSDLVVQSKKELAAADYFRSYDLRGIGGKLLVKPEDFKTKTDKKKKEQSVVYLPRGSNVVYYSSYGENSGTDKDIYTSYRLPNGTYSAPKKVEGINTTYDEDYPFLHPNGNTIYFSSKGHNSMGGYDIFKSDFDEATGSWGKPVNLEFPINSPDDDFLFVTDSLEETAFFSTGRQSPPGKIDVLKIKTERPPIDLLVIKGKVLVPDPEQESNSVITVKNRKNELPLGSFETEDSGDYSMELPNGANLLVTVETPGFKTQSKKIDLPVAATSRLIRQKISYDNGILVIENDFDKQATDSNYIDYLKIIEKKARLDVNEGEKKTAPRLISTDTPSTPVAAVSETARGEPVIEARTSATGKKEGAIDNKKLAAMARQDAEESRQEALQLQNDAREALETGQRYKTEADKKLNASAEAIRAAESIADIRERKIAIDNANDLKQSARNEQELARKIIGLGEAIEKDARVKEREASLNDQYARELEDVIAGKGNKASLDRLTELQKEIELSAEKSRGTGERLNIIKSDIEEKEKKIRDTENENEIMAGSIQDIRTAIAEKNQALEKTRKKALKQNLADEIAELNIEREGLEKQLAAGSAKVHGMQEELALMETEMEIASKLRNSGTVAINNTAPSTKETSQPPRNEPEQIKKSEEEPEAKAVKIKEKEAEKDLPAKKNIPAVTSEKTEYQPISALTKTEALEKLDSLSKALESRPALMPDLSSYRDAGARAMKNEAELKIALAEEREKKLMEDIALSKSGIEHPKNLQDNSSDKEGLNSEAETYLKNAQQLRGEAAKTKGAEKKRLEAEASEAEKKAENNFIQVAEITAVENKMLYETQMKNLDALISRNKAPAGDIAKAVKLNEESSLAFRQAEDIRTEANQMLHPGAKLGNLSNAEEKEAEAVLKLQQAVDLLVNSDKEFQPSVAASPATGKEESLQYQLQTVNSGLEELNGVKQEAYTQIYKANELEAAYIESEASGAMEVINSDASLKTGFSDAISKLQEARQLNNESENAGNNNVRLSLLAGALQKQNDAIAQLAAINTSATAMVVKQEPAEKAEAESEVAVESPMKETVSKINADENETPALVNAPADQPTVTAPAVKEAPAGNRSSDLSDTTPALLISRLEGSHNSMQNTRVREQIKQSLDQLKKYEQEEKSVDETLMSLEITGVVPNDFLRTKAEKNLVEAENLSAKAFEARREAETKEGTDRERLLTEASELETQSLESSLKAAEYMRQANEPEIERNVSAIAELLDRLGNHDPARVAEFQAKRADLAILQTQAGNLRFEADQMQNKAAKAGAMSNAEEKENELLQKQQEVLSELTDIYPGYVIRPVNAGTGDVDVGSLKKRKAALRENQYQELTSLTNGFSLEFESLKGRLPTNLQGSDRVAVDSALALNSEAKKLLIRSSTEKDPGEKMKQLNMAAGMSSTAAERLARIVPAAGLARVPDTSVPEETGRTSGVNNAVPPVIYETPASQAATNTVKIEGLEVIRGNAYSASKPIPVDAKIEDGLTFRVQIGAFRTKLPDNAFRGLSPLNAETTQSGYLRYTAGNFNRIENASAVKNDLRGLGYSDAFVVAYFNGKRISLAEALAMLQNEGRTPDPNAPKSAGITANVNVPQAAASPEAAETPASARELERTNGLLYTIQIGVYNKQVSRQRLLNLMPLYTEQLGNGLYRYTAGIYNNTDRLVADKRKVVDLGIRDAFVAAYINGKRVPYAEAKNRQLNDPTIKPEAENPVVFPGTGTPSALVTTTGSQGNESAAANERKNYPTPTAENGVKTTEEGVCYKVQLGAYSREITEEIALKFSGIKTWPVETRQVNNLFIYTIGNFSEARFAKALRDEAVRLGITDAFITVYRDGRKLYGSEASGLLSM